MAQGKNIRINGTRSKIYITEQELLTLSLTSLVGATSLTVDATPYDVSTDFGRNTGTHWAIIDGLPANTIVNVSSVTGGVPS